MLNHKRSKEGIFNDFLNLKHQLQSIAGIVQNDDISVSTEELKEWSESVNELISDLNKLHLEVFEYYK